MWEWLKNWWPVLIVCGFAIAVFDATLSTLLTCHPIPASSGGGTQAQQYKENCTALAGPVLITLDAIVSFFEGHGEAVTAVFTIVLAAFTGTLWWSTDKMWRAGEQQIVLAKKAAKAAKRSAKMAERTLTHLERPWIFVNLHPFLKANPDDAEGSSVFDEP